VLLDAHANQEWNWHNWLNAAKQHAYPKRTHVITLSEARAWLINRGLIVWNASQSSDSAFAISRQGHEALDRGPPGFEPFNGWTSNSSPNSKPKLDLSSCAEILKQQPSWP
jgi:hypothetical protein